ncbi:unnamed protein product [Eruca vesicaria subsp. sativa]|uniref:Peptidase A1 domain-containing protein n=1 Tax=Eruca vesicaria subsp. sativa TaxID=29727 RepID=A0ABC8L096_ERUVS|nr:unnamed protein product [Eruca vesicaria subsp. sativa]
MGGLTHLIVFVSMFAAITLISEAQYILPIFKDEPSKQYHTIVFTGSATSSSPVNLLLDLGTNLPWLNCRNIKSLSSLRVVTCQSSTCKSIPGNACDGKHCLYREPNPFLTNHTVTKTDRVVQDKATIFTTVNGQPPSLVSFSPFMFSCAVKKNLQGLASPIAGVLGLSPGEFPFWRQVTSAFNVVPKFALCLPSSNIGKFYMGSTSSFNTPLFGGNNPVPMTMTPLKIASGKYLISVESIYVDGVPLPLNPSLLEGGAKLSTVVPYTVLQTDIYNALAQSFTLKATKIGMTETTGHAPFKHCYEEGASGKNMDVSVMEIGLPGNGREVKWRFQGANMVERVSETVICLAFVDGGKNPNESMVIGTQQLQEYLIEFDFSTTRMAFSDPLVLHNTSCSR